MIEVVSRSPEETRALGASLARVLRPGDVVELAGDLGAGKTCFVQGAAAARGVRTPVTSPSFVLVREYAGDVRIVHVDVYRLDHLQELEDLGYEDVFADDAVAFVEWGDAVEGMLPPDRFVITLSVEPDDARRIRIDAVGEARARLEEISSAARNL